VTAALAWSHRVTEIPEAGLDETRTASAAECAAVAEALDILACDDLKAGYTVSSLGQGRYRMRGRVKARVTQACVVSLEPVMRTVDDAFDVEFWPPGTLPEVGDAEVEVMSVPDIEPIPHGIIEAGRVISEILSASLDPYPRQAGADFEWQEDAGSAPGAEAGPFAALKNLKK
jgi:hypothetical protein